jgi:peptide/nickel transport system substrate-binding protein
MTRITRCLTPLLLAAVVAGCSGRDTSQPATTAVGTTGATGTTGTTGANASTTVAADVTAGASPTTPEATGDVDAVTWALYREPNTLDPIYAFDYPENTAITSMCESLLLQQPDGTIAPGLATLTRPNGTTMVFTLRDGVTFWDGSPMTTADVVFSLERQADPALGGFYGAAFSRVKSIEATGPKEVTLTLSTPDYWLDGELSSMAGVVLSKAYVESKGQTYGTPAGGVMCTGAYQLDKWTTGDRVSVKRNEAYRNGAPKVGTMHFLGVPDEATLTSGLLSGDVDGSYIGPMATLDRLSSSPSLTVSTGPSYASPALVISSLSGALGDAKVRSALSMAIDREGLATSLYGGKAVPAKAIANPGTWGYGRQVFESAWEALPEPARDIEAAKALVQEAGASGKTVTLATTNEIASIATMVNAVKAGAEEIGLKVELRPVSAANYINLFIDPSARQGIDGFVTVNYPDFADPAALYATFVLPDGSQNFSGYSNPELTGLMDKARTTADPQARAGLVAQAQEVITQELPWIGLVVPSTVLVTSSDLTGAPSSFTFMNAPWAAGLGAAG